jgi:hypothetical protein
MRPLLVGLLLAGLVACSEPVTDPTTPTTAPPPSFAVTTTSVTIDFDYGSNLCGGEITNTLFPPLTLLGWNPSNPSWWCVDMATDHTPGTTDGGVIFAYIFPNLGQSSWTPTTIDLGSAVHSVSFWLSNDVLIGGVGASSVSIYGNDVHGANVATVVGQALSSTWTQVTLTATGNQITLLSFVPVGGEGYIALDDVTLVTESTGPTPVFTGFFQPVDNDGILNIAKAGSAIPVKFSLGGDFGLGVLIKVPTASAITCPTGDGADAIEQTATTPNGLTYDGATGQYTYVWKTQAGWKGTCKQLHMPLSDGLDHTALFQFK